MTAPPRKFFLGGAASDELYSSAIQLYYTEGRALRRHNLSPRGRASSITPFQSPATLRTAHIYPGLWVMLKPSKSRRTLVSVLSIYLFSLINLTNRQRKQCFPVFMIPNLLFYFVFLKESSLYYTAEKFFIFLRIAVLSGKKPLHQNIGLSPFGYFLIPILPRYTSICIKLLYWRENLQ